MAGSGSGAPLIWDGRGGVRPERLARRKRLARVAATLALAVAVPAVVGSSAGWWSNTTGSGLALAPGGGTGAQQPGSVAVESLVPDPLDIGGPDDGADGGADAGDPVGLGGGLLDGGAVPGAGCGDGLVGDAIRVGIVVDRGAGGVPGVGPDDGQGPPLEVAAASAAVELVNCAGGVLGRPVEVVVADVEGSALAVRGAVAGLVDQGVSMIVGPASVEVVLQAAEAAGPVPIVVPWSIEPALDDHDRGLFLIDPDVVELADSAAHFALERGWRRVAVSVGSGSLDDLAATTFEVAFEAGGGSVVPLSFSIDDDGVVDLDDQLGRLGVGPLSSAPPDVVVVMAEAGVAVAFAQALAGAGVDVPLLAIDRRQPFSGWETLPVGVELGVEVVGRWPAEPEGRATRLWDLLVGVGATDVTDPIAASRVADAVFVGLDAVERAAMSSPEAVAAQLRVGRVIDGVGWPVGVWPGRDIDDGVVPIPVLGANATGSTLSAAIEPRGG